MTITEDLIPVHGGADFLTSNDGDQEVPKSFMSGEEGSYLATCSDVFDDIERTRIATENRVRSLVQDGIKGTPDHQKLVALLDGLKNLEHQAELELKRSLRKHPMSEWMKTTSGIGEKQGARLLASIGDPYIATLSVIDKETKEPVVRIRTVGQLWAYCGLHVMNGVAVRRKAGVKSNWNGMAKMRSYLVAEGIVKAGIRKLDDCDDDSDYDLTKRVASNPLAQFYLDGRAKYADSTHLQPCPQCGKGKGKPALPGEPLKPGHKHQRSLRLVQKELLKAMWVESRRLHEV